MYVKTNSTNTEQYPFQATILFGALIYEKHHSHALYKQIIQIQDVTFTFISKDQEIQK